MKQRLWHRSSEASERCIVAARGADVELAARMSELAPNKPTARPAAASPRGEVDIEAEIERRAAVGAGVEFWR